MQYPTMYVVVSFDFGGSSAVKVHACFTDMQRASGVFERLVESYAEYNKKRRNMGAGKLVDLVELDDGFVSEEGLSLYWGTDMKGARVVKTNNVVVEHEDDEEHDV